MRADTCSEHTKRLSFDILAEDYRNADDGYTDTAGNGWPKMLTASASLYAIRRAKNI